MGKDTIILSIILFNLFFLAFIGGIIVFIREYRKKKKTHEEELENVSLMHKKELLETQVEIQTQTMSYIGREIHDNVGQKLTLSSLYLQQLVFEEKIPTNRKNIILKVNEIIDESLSDLRQLSKSLTDDTIRSSSLSELIESECKKTESLKAFEITFDNNSNIDVDSYQVKSILLRVIQEFIQNSLKHSNCERINILMLNQLRELTLILKDDGVGFEVNNHDINGVGLKSIKKRVEMLNGVYQIKSNKEGTELIIKINV